MKAIHLMIAAAAFAIAQPAQAGVNDQEVIIYRFPGVLSHPGAENTGVATSFHCTNFSGVTENFRLVIRDQTGTLVSNNLFPILHLQTLTISTKGTAAYVETALNTGFFITQGTAAIAATSTNIICTAMTIDASTVAPVGVALRGIRFSPVPGSQE